MKWISTITSIGAKALTAKDEMVILFGPNANAELAAVSVIQQFDRETPVSQFVFKAGDTLTVAGTTFTANYVGAMVAANMKALGHATLIFNTAVPRKPLLNSIYLSHPDQVQPEFRVEDELVFEHR
ncbi:MAG: PTS glucitol/sorbitol transporter subunit IIA [Lactobacillus sp.]|nr:PTS glucitol/sorbitol transporter subunit IIA [Lactobacillus sp.]MDN6042581.1 PTS glucitol/sorbitol transporter subunit IIA [Lactobacillus sp.]MDN6052129.1 PTS glucitol/sorbitol transporter subunit IIA [Lactobacillus sp.]